MTGLGQIFLHIEIGVAKGGLGLGGAPGEGRLKCAGRLHQPQAAPAAAGHSFDEDRCAAQAIHEGGGFL